MVSRSVTDDLRPRKPQPSARSAASARSSAIAAAISSPSAASETTTYRSEKCFSGDAS